MVDMAKKDILPAALKYTKELCDMLNAKANCRIALASAAEETLAMQLSGLCDDLYNAINALEVEIKEATSVEALDKKAEYLRDMVKPGMALVREKADSIELLIPSDYYPYPDYGTLLFSV